ncbi:hypothetical protein ILYODFUR_031311 [Ilyodon furcidens]|uniref:Uncharacterized protein n=1 Tax=Ilyodon furcidens TaxID=33524 RepID=A0ABV0VK70_9TELE
MKQTYPTQSCQSCYGDDHTEYRQEPGREQQWNPAATERTKELRYCEEVIPMCKPGGNNQENAEQLWENLSRGLRES